MWHDNEREYSVQEIVLSISDEAWEDLERVLREAELQKKTPKTDAAT